MKNRTNFIFVDRIQVHHMQNRWLKWFFGESQNDELYSTIHSKYSLIHQQTWLKLVWHVRKLYFGAAENNWIQQKYMYSKRNDHSVLIFIWQLLCGYHWYHKYKRVTICDNPRIMQFRSLLCSVKYEMVDQEICCTVGFKWLHAKGQWPGAAFKEFIIVLRNDSLVS